MFLVLPVPKTFLVIATEEQLETAAGSTMVYVRILKHTRHANTYLERYDFEMMDGN